MKIVHAVKKRAPIPLNRNIYFARRPSHIHTYTHRLLCAHGSPSAPKSHTVHGQTCSSYLVIHTIAETISRTTLSRFCCPAWISYGEPNTAKENWNRKEKVIKKNSPDFSWSHPWVRFAFGITANRVDQNSLSARCWLPISTAQGRHTS